MVHYKEHSEVYCCYFHGFNLISWVNKPRVMFAGTVLAYQMCCVIVFLYIF